MKIESAANGTKKRTAPHMWQLVATESNWSLYFNAHRLIQLQSIRLFLIESFENERARASGRTRTARFQKLVKFPFAMNKYEWSA